LQLAEVLPSHPLSPGRQGNRVTTSKHRERDRNIVLQVKLFLPPPLHRSGHADLKVRVYSMSHLNMNNHTPRDHQLSFRISWALNVKEILP
jgi:hypothetical protein